MENLITLKQQNYLLKLDPTLTVESLANYTIKQAGILIAKLKKGFSRKQSKAKVENFAHGYKVGDVLYASWGYEQTNLDFFQVVAATEHSIRVKEVAMNKTSEEGICPISRDVAYDPKSAKPLAKSFWFKDEEQQGKGKLLRVGCYEYNGKKSYYVRVHNRYSLYHYEGEKLYESWGY